MSNNGWSVLFRQTILQIRRERKKSPLQKKYALYLQSSCGL